MGGDFMKLTKEILDKVRDIEGFPIGKDEDIIELSDPPYYTACPNPFINDFIEKYGTPYDEETDDYSVEPYAADVSEGKNDPIYYAHSYHTKVPHKAIMRYILHYTKPGDIIFDGFCGTGMTGVAAQMCGNPDKEFKLKIEQEMGNVEWGARRAILNDLSPAATFIAYNYNTPVDAVEFEKEAKRILGEVEKECGWMYETQHVVDGKVQSDVTGKPLMGKVNYIVWSDVFVCPNCTNELIFWDAAVNKENGKVKKEFQCYKCGATLKKKDLERATEKIYDYLLKDTIGMAKQVPVLINYSVGRKRYNKKPDEYDLKLIQRIEDMDIPYWFPIDRMPEGDESRRNDKQGITHVHHYYTRRNLYIASAINNKILNINNLKVKHALLFGFNNVHFRHCRLNAMRFNVSFPSNITSGTLYIPSMQRENNFIHQLKNKYLKRLIPVFKKISVKKCMIVSTSSTTKLNINSNFIDYIFTDPPFGNNLMYSELNYIWESWFKVFTNNSTEAIINKVQKKGLYEYQGLMEKCFAENYRILKPGRWMTVEFHNSKNSIWNAIQEAILKAGFVIANVRTLDKQQGSFKQVTTTTAVKQDLIISAYKPKESFVQRFLTEAGTEEGVWSFIRQHLSKLPVAVENHGKLDVVPERQNYLLYDSMVAFHIQKGATIPMSAADFYVGLQQRFPERDGMYFLPDQVNVYDAKRLTQDLNEQLSLFVIDEKTAIQWLRSELRTPQTYQDIQPKFLQELRQMKHEKMPELRDILEENFLQDEAGRWYVPDVNKQSDLEKLRDKRLLKEFEEYRSGKGKLKIFRTEAIRAGFKHCWREKDYKTIVSIGERLPEKVVQEDHSILMYYDNSLTRIGD
jgi:DNA modification methylase/predicted RNA-binding Zn-ribbon protein involved in translation (DUF1610 family)